MWRFDVGFSNSVELVRFVIAQTHNLLLVAGGVREVLRLFSPMTRPARSIARSTNGWCSGSECEWVPSGQPV
jgi:hypothetical protein